MEEWVKIVLSALTLVVVAIGVVAIFTQMQSVNEIRLEASRSNILASIDRDSLIRILAVPLGPQA